MLKEEKYNKNLVVVIAAIAATGGLLFGFDTGVISGAIPFFQQDFQISNSMVENITTAGLVGAVIGAMFTGRLSDIIGRKKVILMAAVVFIIGAAWSGWAPNDRVLIAARLFIGLAIGISSFSVPLYIAEISPTKIRGRLVSLFQLLITIGILVSYLSDLLFANNNDLSSWRPMFYVGVIPGLILFIGMLFLPETPRWLMSKGREDESRHVLKKIEEPSLVEDSIRQMKEDIERAKSRATFREVFKPWLRTALMIAVGIMFFQQFVGINTVIYYSPKIFMIVGFEGARAGIWGAVSVGVVNVVFTVLSLFLIDKIGRRKLYFIGLSGIIFSLLALGTVFAFHSSLGDTGKWFAIVFVWIYIAFFAISLGPLGWLFISEVFPLRVRGIGSSIGSLSNWLFNGLVAFTFFKIVKLFTASGTGIITHEKLYDTATHTFTMQAVNNGNPAGAFWFYAFIGIVGLVWGYYFLPETKGISLEKIEEHWRKGGKPRDLKE
ncbi:Arabinose-proton symporter [hydrothermal vent metagenome]|uniref:Arabinose-proton symporter n=1 Tax=hydrothermal vent metagenome TaxID=652676 RepID=A0A3B0UI30_9ZZZZ